MNDNAFKTLHYTLLGMDLVELRGGHIWAGGAQDSEQGISFAANMPTLKFIPLPA